MKKDKHITVNINDVEYNKIKTLADKEQRTLTNYTYLLIIKGLERVKE